MSATVAWKVWEGSVVEGKFPLKQWLGGSDHSAVFLTEFGPQKAAIKLVEASSAESDRLLANWHRAAQLSHPNLIRIFDSGRCQLNGVPLIYVVLEHAEEDLQQIIPQRPLSAAEVGDLLPPLLDALAFVHGKGFVHGRVTPANVLAVGDQLKLSSDPISPPAEAGSGRTRRDVYDAPETSAGIVTPEGDLWSVGATVVAALTQSVPLTGDAGQGDPGLPTSIPEPFRGIARECLHLDPKQRCSIAEIFARLQPEARTVPVRPEPVIPEARSGGRGKVIAGLLATVVVIGLAVFYLRGRSAHGGSQASVEPPAQTASASPTKPAQKAEAPKAQTPKVTPTAGSVTKRVIPDVPQSARNTITGHVKVSVHVQVDAAGKVTAAKLASAGPSQYFANQALKAAQQWEFSPPEAGGQPSASVWLLHFRFGRSGTEATPERVSH